MQARGGLESVLSQVESLERERTDVSFQLEVSVRWPSASFRCIPARSVARHMSLNETKTAHCCFVLVQDIKYSFSPHVA